MEAMPHDPAKPEFTPLDVPPGGLETPYGILYRPLASGLQILVLFAAFIGGPAFAWVIGQVPGDLSQTARDVLFVPMVAIFFLGYGLWIARLNAIAFHGIGLGLLKALFKLIVFRRKPEAVADFIPSRDKLLEMMVRAQKAGSSFAPVGWLVGVIAGLTAMLFDSALHPAKLFLLVGGGCVIWAHLLAWLGRRNWLPFMESE